MCFFLLFLVSAMVVGPLVSIIHTSVVDFGSVEGSDSVKTISRGWSLVVWPESPGVEFESK